MRDYGNDYLCIHVLRGYCMYDNVNMSADKMISDMTLGIVANMMGVSMFLLVVLYHYVDVNFVNRPPSTLKTVN